MVLSVANSVWRVVEQRREGEKGMDAVVCKACTTRWHRACGEEWDGTCPQFRTDKAVDVFEMPTVQAGQVVIEGEEGVSGGEDEGEEEEGVAETASGGRTWRACGFGGCVYRTKNGPSKLKQHKAAIHGIDIVWHDCPELGCEYKAKEKEKGSIKQHRADVHDIGVTWH